MLGKAGSSKNMKKFFVFLLVVICLGMGAGVVYMKSSEDNEGPKITFEEGKDTNYTSDMTEEDLLKDVKAQDDRDGDVTESLTVETIYPKNDGKQVSVIFVAKDKNNNVTKKEFTMEAQDGSAENPQLGLIMTVSQRMETPQTPQSLQKRQICRMGQKQTAQMLKAEIPQKEN